MLTTIRPLRHSAGRALAGLTLALSLLMAMSGGLVAHAAPANNTSSANTHQVSPVGQAQAQQAHRAIPNYTLCSAYYVVNVQDKPYPGQGVKINGVTYSGSMEVWLQAAYDSVNTSHYCGLVRGSYYFYCGDSRGCPSFTMGTQVQSLGGPNSLTRSFCFGCDVQIYGHWVGDSTPGNEPGEGTPDGYGTIYYSN